MNTQDIPDQPSLALHEKTVQLTATGGTGVMAALPVVARVALCKDE